MDQQRKTGIVMDMKKCESQAEFEKWASFNGYNVKDINDGNGRHAHYVLAQTSELWMVWQASREELLAQVEISDSEPQSVTEDDGCPKESAVLKRFWRAHQLPIMDNHILKPCPFCGSSDVLIHDKGKVGTHMHQGERVFTIGCYDCGSCFPGMYEDHGHKMLIHKWNTRI